MKAKAKPAAQPVSEIKQTVMQLLSNFVKEEHGNRVTNNNMLALQIQIGQAFDGQITTKKPEANKE
jgi:ABC-type polysaccharide/polyol phosphate transport system ATPase subunit